MPTTPDIKTEAPTPEHSPSTGWREIAEILDAPLAHEPDPEVSTWN